MVTGQASVYCGRREEETIFNTSVVSTYHSFLCCLQVRRVASIHYIELLYLVKLLKVANVVVGEL